METIVAALLFGDKCNFRSLLSEHCDVCCSQVASNPTQGRCAMHKLDEHFLCYTENLHSDQMEYSEQVAFFTLMRSNALQCIHM